MQRVPWGVAGTHIPIISPQQLSWATETRNLVLIPVFRIKHLLTLLKAQIGRKDTTLFLYCLVAQSPTSKRWVNMRGFTVSHDIGRLSYQAKIHPYATSLRVGRNPYTNRNAMALTGWAVKHRCTHINVSRSRRNPYTNRNARQTQRVCSWFRHEYLEGVSCTWKCFSLIWCPFGSTNSSSLRWKKKPPKAVLRSYRSLLLKSPSCEGGDGFTRVFLEVKSSLPVLSKFVYLILKMP